MKFTTSRALVAAFAAIMTVAAVSQTAWASPKGNRGKYPAKHDSNTLHKLGNAIQYPFRKLGENTSATTHKTTNAAQYSTRKVGENASVAAHEGTNKNSIERDRTRRTEKLVTPAGHTIALGHTRSKYAHHHYRSHKVRRHVTRHHWTRRHVRRHDRR